MLLGNILLGLATLAGYIAPFVDPKSYFLFAVCGLLFPVWLVLHLAYMVIWSFVEIKYVWISFLIVCMGWMHIQKFFAFGTNAVADEEKKYSLVTLNISNAAQGYDRDTAIKKEKRQALLDALEEWRDEDILCFQEVGEYANEVIHKAFPKFHFHRLNRGAIIVSQHPFLKKGEVDFGSITNSCLWADIDLGFDTVRVYSIHLESNKISTTADRLIEEQTYLDEKGLKSVKNMLRLYQATSKLREEQVQMIRAHIAESPYPVILSGDFNDTPISYTYRQLSMGFQDAFVQTGRGIGATYAGKIPFLRIDYVLLDPQFKVHHCKVLQGPYSDHYPVAVLFSK